MRRNFFFSEPQAGANPTFPLIARPPAFDIAAHDTNGVENGFNRVGGAKRFAQWHGDVEFLQREGFLQALLQTARGAGAMNLLECAFGFLVSDEIPSVGQLLLPSRPLLQREMLADIALLVLLAADHQSFVSAELADRSAHGSTTVQPHQHALTRIEPTSRQSLQQEIADLLVLGRALVIAQDRFRPGLLMPNATKNNSLRNSTPSNIKAHSRSGDRSRWRRSCARCPLATMKRSLMADLPIPKLGLDPRTTGS